MTLNRRAVLAAPLALAPLTFAPLSACASFEVATQRDQIVWTFDRLTDIGGETTHVEGAPQIIDTLMGAVVRFDGVDDALFIDRHPLAGASTFTFEAVFRPDGGPFEQRWFHLQSDEAPGGPGTRIMFEIRVVEGGWYLDAFTKGEGYNKPLIETSKLHPLGQWAHVAQTFDGTTYRSFVNGELQTEAEIAFKPQGPGRSSVGTRINRVNYFNGAVREARFTPRALAPAQFTSPFR
ncbi:LamG domain-containing protein [Brevundimonas sp.]|uniref:LamG domain-containing protein n=1 Tax=Brevundimonas sp. TaxID=1871086 RepID=UPI002899E31C|nr:LamG domain-containing protein [Brevundimonas sp.]